MPPDPSSPRSSTTRRRWFAGLAAASGLGLLGAHVQAQGWHRHGGVDPEERARRMAWRIGRMVREVGGTPQQQSQLVAIATAAVTDIKPLRDQVRQARLRSLELLSVPVIDRVALEQQRVLQVQAQDARSRRMLQAMADSADVLTPEQRAKLAARMKERMQRRGS